MKKISSLIALTIIFVMVLSNISFAITDTKSLNEHKSKLAQIKQNEKDQLQIIKKTEKFVLRNSDGTFSLKGQPSDISKEKITPITNSMNEINALIKKGVLSTDSNLKVYADSKYVPKSNHRNEKYIEYDEFFNPDRFDTDATLDLELGSKTLSLTTNSIVTYAIKQDGYSPAVGLYFYWWGAQLALNERTTQGVIKALNGGSATAALIGALQAGGIITSGTSVATFIISGVLWVGSAAIDNLDHWGNYKGVYFKLYAYSFPTCWYRK